MDSFAVIDRVAIVLFLSSLLGLVIASVVILSLISIYVPNKGTDLVSCKIAPYVVRRLYRSFLRLAIVCRSSFALMVSRDTGTGPAAVAVADFNKDGDLDLAVADYVEGTISILLGSGDGGFDSHYKLSNGQFAGPNGIAVGDVNNDGHMDVAVVNSNASQFGIFLGQGNGKFSSQMTCSTGRNSSPLGLALGDVNNDKILDVVVSDNATGTLMVFLGEGNGRFDVIGAFATGTNSEPYSLVIEDLNRDKYLDLVVTNSGTNNIGVFLGDGTGNFARQQTFSTDRSPRTLVAGHFNEDKILDIATANFLANSVSILLGNGDGTFTQQRSVSTGEKSFPYAIDSADFDRDGRLDLVVANSEANNVGVLIGSGNGTFRQGGTYGTGQNSYPDDVAVGDFNGDQRVDIISTNYNHDTVGIFQNTCS